jgi:hypothetical protein
MQPTTVEGSDPREKPRPRSLDVTERSGLATISDPSTRLRARVLDGISGKAPVKLPTEDSWRNYLGEMENFESKRLDLLRLGKNSLP